MHSERENAYNHVRKKITKEALFRNKRFKFDVNGFAKCFKTGLPFFWNPYSFCISERCEILKNLSNLFSLLSHQDLNFQIQIWLGVCHEKCFQITPRQYGVSQGLPPFNLSLFGYVVSFISKIFLKKIYNIQFISSSRNHLFLKRRRLSFCHIIPLCTEINDPPGGLWGSMEGSRRCTHMCMYVGMHCSTIL